MAEAVRAARRGRRARIAERAAPMAVEKRPVWPGLVGGQYKPLSDRECQRIHDTALDLLEHVGMAGSIPVLTETVTAAGGWMTDAGRLCYPRGLVEDVLAKTRRRFVLPGQTPEHDMDMGGRRLYCGTGGAAPYVVDMESGGYRESTLADLYDFARLVDRLDNIHFFWRTVVARDAPTPFDLDLNTAYACMMGTRKHIGVSLINGDHVAAVIDMFDTALGGPGEFRKMPFCSMSCCHVVPPLRFAAESCDAMDRAIRLGMPVLLVSAGQAGATSPAALAGSVVQAVAEVLAGLVFCNLVDPGCRTVFATWPFVSDLRTGAMSGGSGEQALLMAACAQMAGFYDIPGSVAAGMADAKIPDAQSGGEKGYTTVLAAQAGSCWVQECAGMQASLLGCSLESMVVDNDLLGAVQRTVRGVEVTDETLSYEVIKEVVTGPGHYLGHDQTVQGMERDYVYPEVGDRNTPGDWEQQGSRDVRERARAKVRAILAANHPDHIAPSRDAAIRDRFNILLPEDHLRPGSGRW